MKRTLPFFLLALCPLLPTSSQFAYAIVLSLAFIFFFLCTQLVQFLINILDFNKISFQIKLIALTGSAIVFYMVLKLISPILAMSLDIYIFISAFIYIIILDNEHYKINFHITSLAYLVIFYLSFTFIRELIGKGTISIPTSAGIFEIIVIHSQNFLFLFISTMSGGLILFGILTWLSNYFKDRFPHVKD